jgi:hypothetical protein
MAYMGALNALSGVPAKAEALLTHSALKKNFLDVPELRGEGQEALSKTEARHQAMAAALSPWADKVGMDPDELRRILELSSSGSPADLASELGNSAYQKTVGNGKWAPVKPSEDGWGEAYQRAIQQIVNSPTAMKAMEGASPRELRAFALNDPAGQKEWLELAGSHGKKLDDWIAGLQGHVDHYVPTPEMRVSILDKGKATSTDLEKWFAKDGPVQPMDVHGESASVLSVNPLADAYTSMRERAYHLAGEAPETILAKAHIYTHSFRVNLAGIVARREAAGAGKIALDSPEMMAARKQADRIVPP